MGVSMVYKELEGQSMHESTPAQLLGQIDESIKTVRRIAYELRPIILDYEGLPAALQWYCNEFKKRHHIDCKVETDIPDDFDDKKIAISLFRIFQETFTNVVRHANARHVTASLILQKGEIVLTIADDGIGIDLEKARQKRSFGLLGMEERVKLIGGHYQIGRNRPKGTLTKVVVPYG
jgi:signal transduction histidine kinase